MGDRYLAQASTGNDSVGQDVDLARRPIMDAVVPVFRDRLPTNPIGMAIEIQAHLIAPVGGAR